MGIDVTQLPGMGGDTGTIVIQSVQTIENAVLCVATASLFNCFEAILNAAELVYDLFLAFFPTRPKVGKDSASDDTALFFIPAANPIIALWGIGIRDLETQGIPTSTSAGPGYAKQLALATAVANDLVRQFDGPNAGKVTFGGLPATGANVFALYHQLGFRANHPDSNATAIQERIKLDQLYTQLVKQGDIDPKTGFPPKPPPPPPKCPPGQHWDGTKCVPDTPPPPPGGPDQDEFQDCCDETQAALAAIQKALSNLSGAGGDAACCTNVVNAIGGLGTQLSKIAIDLTNLAAGGVNLNPVVGELTAIAFELKRLAGNSAGILKVDIVASVPLATATVNVEPTDLSGVVAQLTKLVEEGDVKQTVLDYLTQQGFMTGADAQIIQGASWSDAIVGVFRTSGWNALLWVASWVGITWTGKTWTIAPIGTTIAKDVDSVVTEALKAGSAPLFPVIKGLIDAVVSTLKPTGTPALGNSTINTELLVSKTLAPALILNAVMLVFDYLGWDIGETLTEYVTLASELTGLAEVKEITVGQLMQAGPIAAARLQAQRTFRQTLPGAGQVTGWHARGLTALTTARSMLALGGFEDAIQTAQLAAAYQGINPRQLLRLIPTGLFTDADLTDEMNFSGMRPASQHRMLLAAPYLATEPWRSQLRSALEAEYSAGLMTDNELVQALDSAEHNFSRDFLILDRLHAQERVTIAKALESEYTTMYLGSLTDHATYTANLSGMGLQQWKVDALAGVADARRAATLARQMAAAERALVRATAAKERQAAMEGYATGTLDAVGLAAALLLTGLTAQQAAAWVTLATLKRKGSLRWVYGQQLNPAAAALLKQRVADLTKQRTGLLLTDAQYTAELEKLKITDPWLNALRAKADAAITPKKSAFVWPVETS
jgi:hypothetical protein